MRLCLFFGRNVSSPMFERLVDKRYLELRYLNCVILNCEAEDPAKPGFQLVLVDLGLRFSVNKVERRK